VASRIAPRTDQDDFDGTFDGDGGQGCAPAEIGTVFRGDMP